jgi:(p)ppGpp synthase/HD superfamily hydrolase
MPGRAVGLSLAGRTGPVNRRPDHQGITAMSLHEITAAYGEPGLRVRLAHEQRRLASAVGRIKIGQTLALASELHAGDRRQNEPYINHPLRVALRIMCHYGVLDPDVICAALLHDTVEDHADDLSPDGRSGALAVLAARFGRPVAVLVAAVTNPECQACHDKDGRYLRHLTASLAECPWARVVKASDFTDNGIGLHYTTGAKATQLARKYTPLVPVLKDLIARPDTPLADDVKATIRAQLDTAAKQFAVVLDEGK